MGAGRSVGRKLFGASNKTKNKLKSDVTKVDRTQADVTTIAAITERHAELNERLKSVFVKSDEASPVSKPITKPQDRSILEADQINVDGKHDGYLTVTQLIEAIENHRKDADIWTAEKISSVYKIEEVEANNLIKHFGNFYFVTTSDDPKLEFHPLHK